MLIYPGVTPFNVTGALQVFDTSNLLMQQPFYHVLTVAAAADPVPTLLGLSFVPACTTRELFLPVDTLLVPGGSDPDVLDDPDVLAWLRNAALKARRYGSICTGAFALGSAGLIAGKRVTSHWAVCPELARRYPTAKIEPDSIFVRDGNLYSSGGFTAGIDMALALLEEDHGRDLALKVAQYLVLVVKRSGGQAQMSSLLRAQFSSIPRLQKLQRWCHDNLAGDLSVRMLARRVSMSERNFIRVFRKHTGQSPAEFVMKARITEACRLLEQTDKAPKTIAELCGLNSVITMRRVFKRQLRESPSDYRKRSQKTRVGAIANEPDNFRSVTDSER